MAEIPSFLIEYFLLGRTRFDMIERYTQDGGIVTDVWLAFAKDPSTPQRVLVAPSQGTSAVVLGHTLHHAIIEYRRRPPGAVMRRGRPRSGRVPEPWARRRSAEVSPLENFVAVTLYLDELLRIVLPLTTWWHRKHLTALRRKAERSGPRLEMMLERAILNKLGREREVDWRRELAGSEDLRMNRRVVEAAPLAALIGVLQVADQHPEYLKPIIKLDPRSPGFEAEFAQWINHRAEDIAAASRAELSRPSEPYLVQAAAHVDYSAGAQRYPDRDEPPELIQRVFLDRSAMLADTDANCTVKADAATRVFDVSCRGINWAIIDSGIASAHPAFLDHGARDRRGQPLPELPTRIRAALDLTIMNRIRNFDLIAAEDGTPERQNAIRSVVAELARLPGRRFDPGFEALATRNLEMIARQLEQRLLPDWNLIEPLIRMSDQDDGLRLVSDHGTHVAGILGADWRSDRVGPAGVRERILEGICPDIGLYDLRVIHPSSRQSTESAILAALEYVQFVNARAGSTGPVIHGVNVSMSIPHDVRNYGCGATPVCVACDNLVGTGVVVVAAAGNRGWNEMETGFGNFVFSSITDPGNAHDVITVGATHRVKPHMYGVSYFSSRGPTGDGRVKPDIVAPGEQIRGPVRGDADDELDGTSMAAPFVSGAAAMLLARHRELIGKPARIKQILCATATDLGREKYFQGHGLVDVLRAMQSL